MQMLESLSHSRKGVAGQVIMAVVISMILVLGVYINASFNKNLDTSTLDADAKDAINKTQINTYNGFKLGSNIPTVLFAGVMIGAVMWFASRAA